MDRVFFREGVNPAWVTPVTPFIRANDARACMVRNGPAIFGHASAQQVNDQETLEGDLPEILDGITVKADLAAFLSLPPEDGNDGTSLYRRKTT